MGRNETEIRKLAYELWEARGRPHGTPEADWYAAEGRLRQPGSVSRAVDESVKESFPASDPPAPPVPDTPPVNADEKWAAAEAAKSPGRRKRSGMTDTEPPPRRSRSGRADRDVTP
jgi:hypothetical protein